MKADVTVEVKFRDSAHERGMVEALAQFQVKGDLTGYGRMFGVGFLAGAWATPNKGAIHSMTPVGYGTMCTLDRDLREEFRQEALRIADALSGVLALLGSTKEGAAAELAIEAFLRRAIEGNVSDDVS